MARALPAVAAGVLAAAERNGALLVSLENLYGYGPTGGKPMTEDLPLAATTVKGRTRAAMTGELLAAAADGRVRVAIGRASDFFGPGVTQGSTLGERVFGNALAGRRADFIGNPDLPHTYSYVPDIAAAWPPSAPTPARRAGVAPARPGDRTTRALLDLVAAEVGILSASGRCPSWLYAPWDWSTRCCGNWPRCRMSSTSLSSWTPASTSPRSGRPARRWPPPWPRPSPGTRPGRHVMTANPEVANAMTTPLVAVTPKPATMNAAACPQPRRCRGGLGASAGSPRPPSLPSGSRVQAWPSASWRQASPPGILLLGTAAAGFHDLADPKLTAP